MGLAERRASKAFQDNHFPVFQKKITDAVGFEVPIEVNWESLALEDESHLYDECWPKVYFEPLIEGLKAIGRDDMGKEALQSSLKKIMIQNTTGAYYGDRWASFENGVLTLDHLPTTNADSIQERTDGLVQTLEKKL
jgi:hypothetical protein